MADPGLTPGLSETPACALKGSGWPEPRVESRSSGGGSGKGGVALLCGSQQGGAQSSSEGCAASAQGLRWCPLPPAFNHLLLN